MLLFFFACARSRELNTTLLLTRLPELNSGQNLAKKYMSAGGNSACYRIWYVHDGDDCSALGARDPQNQDAAQLHMSKLNGFRLPADNKNGCFHITNKLYASLMLLRFTSISAPESPQPPHPTPPPLTVSSPFLCENFAEYGFIAGRQAREASTQHEDRRQAACRQVIN